MDLVKHQKCEFRKNELIISDNITKDEWLEIGSGLTTINGSVQIWIGDWAKFGERKGFYVSTETYENIAEITGYSKRTIQDFKYVADNVSSSLRNEDLSFNHYKEVAKLPPEKQELFLNKAVEEKLSVRELREEIRKNNIELITPKLPNKKYSVIYADPAWPVGSIVMDKWISPIDDKYPTMSIEDIKNLPVNELTAEDCSLFLWTTHSFLPDSFDIIKVWGFKYFCLITWNKGNGWTQNGFHKMTEFLLFAYKGKMNINQYGKAIPTLIAENKTYHSKKPDSIRELIKSKTPEGRLELFARDKYEGWEAWGNEIKL